MHKISSTYHHYTKQTLEHIYPYLTRSFLHTPIKSVDRFALNFNNPPKSSIPFYCKYQLNLPSNSLIVTLFNSLLKLLCYSNFNQAPLYLTQVIQPHLLNRIRNKSHTYDIRLLEDFTCNIRRCRIIQSTKNRGIFMHRSLNLPYPCYKIIQKKDTIDYTHSDKFKSQKYMQMLIQKKSQYTANNYKLQKYYFDSFDNFVNSEYVIRKVYAIDAKIEGKLVFGQEIQVRLPIRDAVTRHILQVENIVVPGRSQQQCTMITDIDWFAQGNPYSVKSI